MKRHEMIRYLCTLPLMLSLTATVAAAHMAAGAEVAGAEVATDAAPVSSQVALPQWAAVEWGMTAAAVAAALPERALTTVADETKDGGALVKATDYKVNGVSFKAHLAFFEDGLFSMRLLPLAPVKGQRAQMQAYFEKLYGAPCCGGDAALAEDGRVLESITWHSGDTGIGLADQSRSTQSFEYEVTVFGRRM